MGSQQLLPGLALVLPLAPADTRPQAVRAHGHVFLPLLQSSKAVVGTVSPLQPAALQRQAGQQPAQADTQLAAVHTAAAVRTATARTAAAGAAQTAAARTEVAGAVAVRTATARTEAAGAVVAHTAAARTEAAGAVAAHTVAARIPVQADKAAATAPAARRHKVVVPHRLARRLALRVPHAIQPLAAEDGHPASKGLVGSPDQPGQHRPVLLWSPRQRRQAAQPPSGR